MTQNEHKGKIHHGFSEKALLGLGALILIFIGGSGTQSSSLLLQGGGFIGLIIGLVVLYIFGKMAWRAMGCLPSFLVVISIIAFILYAIGGFNNGIGGVGQSLRSFLGMQANSQRQMPQNGQIMIVEDEYAPAIDENFLPTSVLRPRFSRRWSRSPMLFSS